MKRALGLVFVACAGSADPPRAEVFITTPAGTAPSSATTGTAVASVEPMNAGTLPINDDEALMIQMTPPKNTRRGPPTIRLDNDTLDGMQRAVIRRVLRQNLATLRGCYDKGLRATPDLGGRVVVRFRIEPSGSVGRSESGSGTTLPSPDVVACVVDAIKPMVFPQQQGGALIVDYPIVFQP